jgi:hypothetical protein
MEASGQYPNDHRGGRARGHDSFPRTGRGGCLRRRGDSADSVSPLLVGTLRASGIRRAFAELDVAAGRFPDVRSGINWGARVRDSNGSEAEIQTETLPGGTKVSTYSGLFLVPHAPQP